MLLMMHLLFKIPYSYFSINEGQSISYVVPDDSFKDVDGDILVYSLTMANNSPLPTWLMFDAATKNHFIEPII